MPVSRNVKDVDHVGPYRVAGTIAQGDRAVVYRAIGPGGRVLALKVHEPGDGERQALSELRLLGFQHPGLAACLDGGRVPGDGRLYTVTELVRGVPLDSAALAGAGRQVDGSLLALRLLAALAFVHEQGLVHRDLKAENVVLERASHRPVVLDFGLCTPTDQAGDELAGTPRALAPELFVGAAASQASDLWAAGLLLAEALLGRSLFDATTPEAMAAERSVYAGLGPADRALIGSGDLAALLDRMLAPDPSDRPTDAHACMAALSSVEESARRTVEREHLGALRRAAVSRHDPTLAARRDAARRGLVWVDLFDDQEGGVSEALGRVVEVARAVAEPEAGLRARLAAADVATRVGPGDVVSTVAALAEHGRLCCAVGRVDAEAAVNGRARLADRLGEIPGVEIHREEPLDGAESVRVLTDWIGEAPTLATRLASAPPATRSQLDRALAEAELSGAVTFGPAGVSIDETALPEGWPAGDVDAGALVEGLPPGALEVLSLLAATEGPVSTSVLAAVLGVDPSPALDTLRAAELVARRRSEPEDLHDLMDGRHRSLLAALLPAEAQRRAALALHLLAGAGADDALDASVAASVARVLTSGGGAESGAGRGAGIDDPVLTAGLVATAASLRRVGRLGLAAAVLQRGQQGVAPDGELRLRLALDRIDVLVRAHRHDDALAAAREAAVDLDGPPAVALREARVLLLRGRADEADQRLGDVPLDEPRALSTEDRALGLQIRSQLRQKQGRLEEALTDVREALRTLGDRPDRRAMALLERAGALERRLGRPEEATRRYEQCLAQAEALGQELLVGTVLYNMGWALADRGQRRRALQLQEEAIGRLEQAGDLTNLSTCLNGLGAASLSMGRVDTARRHLTRALSLARRLDNVVLEAQVLNNIGRALAAEGRHVEAEEGFARSLELRAARSDKVGQLAVHLTRGPLRVGRGDHEQAQADLDAARVLLGEVEAKDWAVEARLLEARLALAGHDDAGAGAVARQAGREAEAAGLRREVLIAADLCARAEPDGEGGAALLRQDHAEETETGPALAALLFTRGRLLDAAGREPAADDDFDRALSILGDSADGVIEARGLVLRLEVDLARLRRVMGVESPDLAAMGELLARLSQDAQRARGLVTTHALRPLAERLAALEDEAEGLQAGRDMTGLAQMADRVRSMERLSEITKALNSERDTQKLLELIVDSAIELTGAARGFLILFDGTRWDFCAARNISESTIREPEFQISHSVARRVVEEGRPLCTANALDDERLAGTASISELKLLSILCVPLVFRGRALGAVYLDHPQVVGRFTARHQETVTLLAEQAAIARENKRLQDGLQESKAQIDRLNAALRTDLRETEAQLEEVKESLDASRRVLARRYDYSNIITVSPRMDDVLALLDLVTDTDNPVIIQGESGTGKELIAKAIHFNGPRAEHNFLSLNCAAISEGLVESELFGAKRGAFTGAERDRKGLFEQAHGGTLFLDEIGDMTEAVQKRLLRVLQEGEFIPVGGVEEVKVDVRILCATHRDLEALVQRGGFRQDLFFRLAVATVQLPPLRERPEDTGPLVEHFFQSHGGHGRKLSPEALSRLQRFGWPGNVRQLENVVRNLIMFAPEAEVVTLADVDRVLLGIAGGEAAPASSSGFGLPSDEAEPMLWKERLEAWERENVAAALERAGGNKTKAAAILGVKVRTFYKMLERLGL